MNKRRNKKAKHNNTDKNTNTDDGIGEEGNDDMASIMGFSGE